MRGGGLSLLWDTFLPVHAVAPMLFVVRGPPRIREEQKGSHTPNGIGIAAKVPRSSRATRKEQLSKPAHSTHDPQMSGSGVELRPSGRVIEPATQ
jgi:hypothetical protein